MSWSIDQPEKIEWSKSFIDYLALILVILYLITPIGAK